MGTIILPESYFLIGIDESAYAAEYAQWGAATEHTEQLLYSGHPWLLRIRRWLPRVKAAQAAEKAAFEAYRAAYDKEWQRVQWLQWQEQTKQIVAENGPDTTVIARDVVLHQGMAA